MKIMIQTWRITQFQNVRLEIRASSLDDVTRQLPSGYYSTFRTFDGGTLVLGLTSHLQRLYKPVPMPEVDVSSLRRQLSALLEPHRPGEARVRAVMTKRGQIYLSIEPLKPLPRAVYEKGVRVETTEIQRRQPRLKSTAFISKSDSERKHIAQEGIFEALLVKDGNILEGMTSNFFYIVERDPIPPCVGTARDNILLGITRETIIDIARGMGLEIKYQPLKQAQLETIAEAFITSSSRGIVPVIQIDNVTIGQGSPGPITKQLMAAYEEYVVQRAEKL
jgi:branched-chain amino acid aminotransferase